MNKPDSYLLNIDSKGFNLTDFSTWGLSNMSHPEGRKMGVLEAYTDVGWTRRCVNVRAKTLSQMPFGIYAGERLVWSNDTEKPEALKWLKLRDYLFRAEVALSLVGAAYALKEGMARQDGTIRRITDLRWWNPDTVSPYWRGPRDERGEFLQFERMLNGTPEYWDRRVVLHTFEPDAFTEQGPPRSTDGTANRINAQILADLADYTSEQLRSGLVKKTVAVAKDGRPPTKEVAEQTESWLRRWLFGRGNVAPKILSGNIDFQTIGSSLDDLAENAISEEQQRAIATGFGVPHSLVMSDAANHATAKTDQINFYTTTVLHQARVISDAMNSQLFGDLGLEMRFEPNRLEAFQAAEAEKAQALVPMVQAGILTVNEARETMGYEAISHTAPTMADEPMDEGKLLDLRRWRTKCEKRGPDVKFRPDSLSQDEAEVIRERLTVGKSLEEAFSPPFADF